MKLPSIEKSNEDDLDNTDNEVGEKTQTIYMGMAFLGALLGLHLYSSLCIDKALFVKLDVSKTLYFCCYTSSCFD